MKKYIEKLTAHSIHIVILLLAGLLLGAFLTGTLVQQNPLLKAFDAFFYNLIHNGPHYKWLDIIISPFNFNFLPRSWGFTMPSFYYFWLGGFFLYIFFKKREHFIWALVTIVLGTLFINEIFKFTNNHVYRERPFTVLPHQLDEYSIKAWKSWPSFPSGHARETALYATIMAAFLPWLKWPGIIFAIFIAYSRVYLGAHYPTDVLAGLLMGFVAGRIVLIVSRELQIIIENRKGKPHETKPKPSATPA